MSMQFEAIPNGVSVEAIARKFVRESRNNNALRAELLFVSADDRIALLEGDTEVGVNLLIFPYVYVGRNDIMSAGFSATNTVRERATQTSGYLLGGGTIEGVEPVGVYRYSKVAGPKKNYVQIPYVIDMQQPYEEMDDNSGVKWLEFDEARAFLKGQADGAPTDLLTKAHRISRIMKEFTERQTVL